MQKQNTDHENLPPFLKEAGKRMPYKVPEGYFEAFPGRIMDRIREQDLRPAKKGIYYTWIGKAAVIAVLLIMGASVWFYMDSPVWRSMNSLSKVDIQSLPIEEIDEELLLEELALNTTPVDSAASDELETYLLETVDEELLIQQL